MYKYVSVYHYKYKYQMYGGVAAVSFLYLTMKQCSV